MTDNPIRLNSGQQVALEKATDFLDHGVDPIFRIDGAAGTGKTEVIKHILKRNPGGLPMAWTGRAVNMLRSKGISNALTIHSALYKPEPINNAYMDKLCARLEELNELHTSTGIAADEVAEREKIRRVIDKLSQPEFSLCDSAPAARAEYLVLDEVSMISADMGRDLVGLGKQIIVVGDDNQLPPIDGNPSYFDGPKDVVLTEIMRQRGTAGDAIIRLATDVRRGIEHRGRHYGPNVTSHITPIECHSDAFSRKVMEVEQVIAGLNFSRRGTNNLCRQLLRYGDRILPDGRKREKLICEKNNAKLRIYNVSMR